MEKEIVVYKKDSVLASIIVIQKVLNYMIFNLMIKKITRTSFSLLVLEVSKGLLNKNLKK